VRDARHPRSVSHLKRSDPRLSAVIDRVGKFQMQYHPPDFHALTRSIVFQQLNGKAASTIFGRLSEACGGERLTPEAILRLRAPKLRSVGLSAQKASYVKNLAKLTTAGTVNFESLPSMDDEGVITHLTQIKGVGVWTSHMFLIFALRRPDVLPVGDYGVRAAMQRLYGLEGLPKPAEMERIAVPWSPWRSVASWYLWRSLDGPVIL